MKKLWILLFIIFSNCSVLIPNRPAVKPTPWPTHTNPLEEICPKGYECRVDHAKTTGFILNGRQYTLDMRRKATWYKPIPGRWQQGPVAWGVYINDGDGICK